jgi:hypothetical protein
VEICKKENFMEKLFGIDLETICSCIAIIEAGSQAGTHQSSEEPTTQLLWANPKSAQIPGGIISSKQGMSGSIIPSDFKGKSTI